MIRIRPLRPEEGAHVIDIWRAAVDATHHFLSPEDRIAIDAEVCAFLPQMPLWLAVDAHDRAIAFMSMSGPSMEALFVHPDHHGKGFGRALVLHALHLEPILTTTVNEQNERALAFYERLGFTQTGRTDVDEQGRPYPLLYLQIDTSRDRSQRSTKGPLRMRDAILPLHDISPAEVDAIEDHLYDHNRRATGHDDALGLAFVIRDDQQRVIAACAGYSWAGAAELKQLWVDEAYRGRGYGRGLLDAFIDEATQRGVGQIWVASYDFQAPALYERAGFERMAEFAGWPAGHSNVILKLDLPVR